MKAAAAILFLCGLWCSSTLGYPGLFGNLTIFSRHSIVTQPYPVENGIRTTVEQSGTSLQFECTVCDIGAPTEHCFEELGVCVTLSDTTVFVIGTDGSLHGTPLSLDPQCTPRYLQMLDGEMVVVCHDPCFHFVTRTGSSFELHPVECGTGQEGIVAEALFWGDPYLFLIELDGNHIFESIPSAASPLTDITPHHNCTNHLSLYPLFSREHFLLWCNTTSGERVYIVDRSNRDHAPSVELSSAPISSPDGRTFAAATGSTLKLYRSDNLAQYPGVKDFGVDIILCTYLNSHTVLIGLDGSGQILVHVEPFINSVGAEGLTTLPYTTSLSHVHKPITYDVFATSNKTGTLYNVLLFNITSGHALDPVSTLSDEPVGILFEHDMAPDPPPTPDLPPTSQLSSTMDHAVTPTPTPTPVSKTSSTSALQSFLSVQSPTPTNDGPTEDSSQETLKKVLCVGGGLLFIGIGVLVCFLFLCVYQKKQNKCVGSKKMCLFSRGPFGQETDPEKGVNLDIQPTPLRQDDFYGRETLTQSGALSSTDIQPFVSTAQGILRSSCGNLQFPKPIPESKAL